MFDLLEKMALFRSLSPDERPPGRQTSVSSSGMADNKWARAPNIMTVV
jgi:hypothetical protein